VYDHRRRENYFEITASPLSDSTGNIIAVLSLEYHATEEGGLDIKLTQNCHGWFLCC